MGTKVMIGLEGLVLYVFVAVQSLVLAGFSRICGGAVEVPGLSGVVGRSSRPALPAEPSPVLPPASVVAPAAFHEFSGNNSVPPPQTADDTNAPVGGSGSSPSVPPAPVEPALAPPRVAGKASGKHGNPARAGTIVVSILRNHPA